MAAALFNITLGPPSAQMTLVFSQDQSGNFWVQFDTFYGVMAQQVTQQQMQQIAAGAQEVANA